MENSFGLLDSAKWPELSVQFSRVELSTALRGYYVTVALGGAAFESKFCFDLLLSMAAAFAAKPRAEVRKHLVAAVRRCIGRLEFLRARVAMPAGAAAVETTLLDQELPPEIRKARRKAREAQRDADKDKAAAKGTAPRQARGGGGRPSRGGRGRGGRDAREREDGKRGRDPKGKEDGNP